MSQENVEAVRRIFEAWASGEWSIGNDYLDEHAVCVVGSDFPAFGAYFGLDGIRAYWRDFLEIEGDPAGIHAAASALGFGPGDYVTDSYVGLFLAAGGQGDMVFP